MKADLKPALGNAPPVAANVDGVLALSAQDGMPWTCIQGISPTS